MSATELYYQIHHTDQQQVLHLLAQSMGAPNAFGDRDELAVNALIAEGPELDAAVATWWHSASLRSLAETLARASDQAIELAALVCAEEVSHLSDDPRVAEARRVRLAWVRGEATDEQRREATRAVFRLSIELLPERNLAVVAACNADTDLICNCAERAGVEARVTHRIRELFESPLHLDYRIAVARWNHR